MSGRNADVEADVGNFVWVRVRPRASNWRGRLMIWRDALMTAAAFAFVMAVVLGVGPFDGPDRSARRAAETGDLHASERDPASSMLADAGH